MRFEPTLNTLIEFLPWPIRRISLQLNRRLTHERASPDITCAKCSPLDWQGVIIAFLIIALYFCGVPRF
jgi:hypothetical protein